MFDANMTTINTLSIRKRAQENYLSELARFGRLALKKPSMAIAVVCCVASQEGGDAETQIDFSLGLFYSKNSQQLLLAITMTTG